jgi:hypothetical protein
MNQLGKSWPSIAYRCASMGLRWVCVRAGMFVGAPALIRGAFDAYGIQVFTWHYAIPNRDAKEIATVLKCLAGGSSGHVLDPEIEYAKDANSGADAQRFVAALRDAVGQDVFLGYAPFCDPKVFPKYPYAEFSAQCTAMPQVYFTAAHKSALYLIDWIDPQWATINLQYEMPILSVWGSNDPRNIDPAAAPFQLEDLTAALDAYTAKPAVSLWALESIHPTAEQYFKQKTGYVEPAPAPAFDLATVAGQQGALEWLGYSPGDVDGVYGPQTRAAVIAFQHDHGCTPDGIFGKKTTATMIAALAHPTT